MAARRESGCRTRWSTAPPVFLTASSQERTVELILGEVALLPDLTASTVPRIPPRGLDRATTQRRPRVGDDMSRSTNRESVTKALAEELIDSRRNRAVFGRWWCVR